MRGLFYAHKINCIALLAPAITKTMQLAQAFQEANKEASHLALRTIHTDLRSRVADALFAIAQQHQYSIFLLLPNPPALNLCIYTGFAKPSPKGFGSNWP